MKSFSLAISVCLLPHMCGICCIIFANEVDDDCEFRLHSFGYVSTIGRRGPDYFSCLKIFRDHNVTRPALFCMSSVLTMRTKQMTIQPSNGESSGDVLMYNGEIFHGLKQPRDGCDTISLFSALQSCSESEILNLVSGFIGPFAFVYYRRKIDKVYVARDAFGQRSLILAKLGNDLILTSVLCHESDFELEIPAGYLVSICADKLRLNRAAASKNWASSSQSLSSLVDGLVAEQFTSSCALFNISLNVKFDGVYSELDKGQYENHGEVALLRFLHLYNHETLEFIQQFKTALQRRLQFLQERFKDEDPEERAHLCLLFSGGVDSLLLAVLIDQLWPVGWPIDLVNVAFERQTGAEPFRCADRSQGLLGLQQLNSLSPHRDWRFVRVDVTLPELNFWRRRRIGRLMKPKRTVMDESLACTLWFASRALGQLPNGPQYRSTAKAVFLGTGADELLAGYSRHRHRYATGGYESLARELKTELESLWQRNLGRDDRVISDHGKESHLPFLDHDFVLFCNSLPIDCKARLDLPRGLGEKLIIRLALTHLGLRQSALVPKKAMQFGSGLAKLENNKEKGSDVSSRIFS